MQNWKKNYLNKKKQMNGKKINGKASEFFFYLLESIKLGKKDDKGEKVSEVALRNFDNGSVK